MAKTELKYVGPHDEVEVDMPADMVGMPVVTVAHNGVLKTSDEHAAALLEQPENWQPAKAAASEKKKED